MITHARRANSVFNNMGRWVICSVCSKWQQVSSNSVAFSNPDGAEVCCKGCWHVWLYDQPQLVVTHMAVKDLGRTRLELCWFIRNWVRKHRLNYSWDTCKEYRRLHVQLIRMRPLLPEHNASMATKLLCYLSLMWEYLNYDNHHVSDAMTPRMLRLLKM